MTNTSCELGHVILTSTWVPILLSKYQILASTHQILVVFVSALVMMQYVFIQHYFKATSNIEVSF